MQRQETAQAKMDDLREMAVFEIPDGTDELLEAHRGELDSSLPSECLVAISRVLEPQLAWYSDPDF